MGFFFYTTVKKPALHQVFYMVFMGFSHLTKQNVRESYPWSDLYHVDTQF